MNKNWRNKIQHADRFVRNKKYYCLFPGCKENAIRGHAIQRASCVEALAEKGLVFTLEPSYNNIFKMKSPDDPLSVVAVGVNDASVFKGYCSKHDSKLFAPAEVAVKGKKGGALISPHLRAITLEYCRKRRNIDFYMKLADLEMDREARLEILRLVKESNELNSLFKKLYLDSIFGIILGSDIDSVDYFALPFTRNLHISCCGCFDVNPGAFDSIIGYNLLSYSDMSVAFALKSLISSQ